MDRVPVSPRALLRRLNRKLQREHEVIKPTRSARWRDELGDYYVVDLDRNAIARKQVNLEQYARELGVLQEYEKLEEAVNEARKRLQATIEAHKGRLSEEEWRRFRAAIEARWKEVQQQTLEEMAASFDELVTLKNKKKK
jgi:hypothetical protein